MAVDLLMRLDPGGFALVPVDRAQAEAMGELQGLGGILKVKITQARNLGFHRKGMALFRFLYNLWEPVLASPEDLNGVPVAKDFEHFRGNVTIAAGYYRQVFTLSGGFVLEPLSLNWGSMDNVEFARVYNRVLDVGLEMIGKSGHLTREQAEQAIDQLLGFA